MEKSRLKSNLQKKAYQNIIMVTLGVIAIIALVIIFGTNILIGFSLLVGKITGNEEPAQSSQQDGYIAPPTLDSPFEATSSATITLTGQGEKNQTISLYRNGDLLDKTAVKSNNSFRFTNVTLENGNNVFKAKVSTDTNKQSDYSNEVTITYSNKPPNLTIDSPQDGQGIKKENSPIKVTGTTDQGASVTVNDFIAIVDGSGKYTYLYTLKDGDNDLKIIATDEAGNKTTKEVKIHTE